MATHVQVPGTLVIDLTAPFNQQGIYNAIRTVYPPDPTLSVVSIAVPFVHINCLEYGIIDPVDALKRAAQNIYNYMMQYYVQPLWNALYSLFKALESLIGSVLDLTIPVFNLHISDLFDPNLGERIRQWVLDLYYNAQQQLRDILDLLGIKWPDFGGVHAPEFDIGYIADAILNSLWGFILKAIKKVIEFIKLGLVAWEAINNNGIPTWSQIWEQAKDAILGYITDLLTNVPTIDQIYDAVVAWAKVFWGKLSVTAEEIMEAIKHFTFGIFGKPFDWDLPWNPSISMPNVDIYKMLTSILLYCKNFLFNIINSFIQAVVSVLEFFGISLGNLGQISIPITLCAVVNEA